MILILNQGAENSSPCCGKFSVCAAAGWRKSSLSRQEAGEVSKSNVTTRSCRAEGEEQLLESSECVEMVFCPCYSRTVFIEIRLHGNELIKIYLFFMLVFSLGGVC